MDSAMKIVRLLIDPILVDTAAGSWNADTLKWSSDN